MLMGIRLFLFKLRFKRVCVIVVGLVFLILERLLVIFNNKVFKLFIVFGVVVSIWLLLLVVLFNWIIFFWVNEVFLRLGIFLLINFCMDKRIWLKICGFDLILVVFKIFINLCWMVLNYLVGSIVGGMLLVILLLVNLLLLLVCVLGILLIFCIRSFC